MKFKKTYSFAFKSSLLLSIFAVVVFAVLLFLITGNLDFKIFFIFGPLFFLFSFVVIQNRVERFIYKRVRKIYNDVSLLDVGDLSQKTITTDIETLSQEVRKFAEGKRLEIASLTERESYRREFLGNVAHELKTPLFTVQGYLLTLSEGAADDKEIRTKYLERANKGVERLTAIVKDLDMISKLETKHLHLSIESFNIIELIQNVFDLLEMKAKKRNITLCFDKLYEFPIGVRGDIERIEQVLINLIVNSIKYGKIGGTTVISIESYNNFKVRIKVMDDGEGIKKEHIPRLFERFYRVDQSRSREQGGSGLGLSIVKHIIEAHNEMISLESTYGKGTVFSFTLEKAE